MLMNRLTVEDREKLAAELDALAAAQKPLREAKKPLDDALAAIDAVISATLERYGVEEPIGGCEACEMMLFEGDMGHRCEDGSLLCADDAPTWGDLDRQMAQPDIITGALPDPDEEMGDGITRLQKRRAVRAHVQGGGSLTDKIVHPL